MHLYSLPCGPVVVLIALHYRHTERVLGQYVAESGHVEPVVGVAADRPAGCVERTVGADRRRHVDCPGQVASVAVMRKPAAIDQIEHDHVE